MNTPRAIGRLDRIGGGLVAGMILAAAVLSGCGGSSGGSAADAGGGPTPPAELGFVNYRKGNPKWLTTEHRRGRLSYRTSPPVGGDHSPYWQNCNGDVYQAPIANEHAVHSLEHGAVWVTYRPDLPEDQIAALARKVRDRSYLFMSPYPDLDAPISVQAWGYQLKVASASDKRIADFIADYRQKASLEPGAACTGGVTTTGTQPLDDPQRPAM